MMTNLDGLSVDAACFYLFLRYGKEHAIKAKEIARPLDEGGLGFHPRYQQELIDELAAHGKFVCSSCGRPAGYYKPLAAAEVEPFVTQLDHRIQALGAKKAALLNRWPELRPTVVRPPRRVVRPNGESALRLELDDALTGG